MLPADSLIGVHGREKLENDILFVAKSREVQNALRQHLRVISSSASMAVSCRLVQAVIKDKLWIGQKFVEGVSIMIEASCDRRLETSHWVVGMLWEDREEISGFELLEWFYQEARYQVLEVEDDQAEKLKCIFDLE